MRRALLALVLTLVATPAFAQLTMSVRPGAFSFAPADVEVRLHVAPGGHQREVLLEIDGEAFYRSSVLPIRTDPNTPSLQPPAWYHALPRGSYVITATLTDCAPAGCGARVPLRRVRTSLRVFGRGEEPEEADEP